MLTPETLGDNKANARRISAEIRQGMAIVWVYEFWGGTSQPEMAFHGIRVTDRKETRVDGLHLAAVAAYRHGAELTLNGSIVGAT